MLRFCLVLALLAAACDGKSTPGDVVDGGQVEPPDADPNAPDADPNAPDADPNAPDADPGEPDAGMVPADGPHPFGTHGGYHPTGVLFPSASQAARDQAVKDYYAKWKAEYIEQACGAGVYRIRTTGGTSAYTVSEAHGYAMLVAVIMEGADPQAHTIFDGLFKYFDAHHSNGNPALMAWAQNESCNNIQGDDSATDGDLDIAYALLLAHRQWGSDGAIDYQAEAEKVMAGILDGEIHPSANTILVGDWVGDDGETSEGTRASDFMVSHLKSFARASGNSRWTLVLDKTYAIVAYVQEHAAAGTGLLPDFIVGATGDQPQPAPSGFLEGNNDGRYGYNSCRVPWRLATDFLMSGEPRSQAAVSKLNTWIRSAAGGDAGNIKAGYKLDGTSTQTYNDLAFTAPFGVAAMVAAGSSQAWLDSVWNEVVDRDLEGYYGDTIKMLDLIVMSGNWWTP